MRRFTEPTGEPRRIVALLAWVVAAVVSACEPAAPPGLCTPGAAAPCRCDDGALGHATCDTAGRWRPCTCDTTCRGGALLPCTCETGGVGLQSCLADGTRTECACEPRCIEGAMGACVCGDVEEGTIRCVEGALTPCDCSETRCRPGSARDCLCPDGHHATRSCVDGELGACACGDAAVVRPDAGVIPTCERCGCEPPSLPPPLEGLPEAGRWEVELDAPVQMLETRTDGYVVATPSRVRVIGRDGMERHAYTQGRRIVASAVMDDDSVVIVDTAFLTVLSPTLAVRTSIPLGERCVAIAALGCGRLLCLNAAPYDRALTVYDTTSGTSRFHFAIGTGGRLVRLPGRDLVLATAFGGTQLLLVPVDGPIVSRRLDGGEGQAVLAGWPETRMIEVDGTIRSLTGCLDTSTFFDFGVCTVMTGAVPPNGNHAMDGDVAGFVYRIVEESGGWAVARYDTATATRVSQRAVLTGTDFPRQLAYDAWGRRVVLAFDRCGPSGCRRFLTTRSYDDSP